MIEGDVMSDFLNRTDAPFDSAFWKLIDEIVRDVAMGQLSARKLLYAEGPFGLGLQFLPGKEQSFNNDSIQLSAPNFKSLTLINGNFTFTAKSIAAFQQSGIRMDIEPLVKTVLEIAAQEDEFLYYGLSAMKLTGLLTGNGIQKYKLKPWNQVGDAVEDIIDAVTKLDESGFHGPYSLALTPSLYNKLFRRYPQTETLEIDHLKSLVTDGIVKAAGIKNGGVLLASSKEFVSITLGQDLCAGFEGPSGRDYIFTISESLALRIDIPQSVCALDAT